MSASLAESNGRPFMLHRHLLLVMPTVILACTSTESNSTARWSGTTDTLPGGAILVKNPSAGVWDSASAWRIEEDFRIGSVEGAGPESFAAIAHVDVDAAGRVYVLDRQSKDVRVFDTGKHVRTMGRDGAGPGELRDPIGMAFDTLGQLWIVDPSNVRYTVFDTAGRFVTSHRRPISSYTIPWPGGFDPQGRLYDVLFGAGGGMSDRSLLRYTSSLEPADTIPIPSGPPQETFKLETASSQTITSIPFLGGLAWLFDGRGGYLWHGMTDSYRIYQSRLDGDTVRIIEREHRRLPVTSEDRAQARERLSWFIKQGGKVDESKFPDLKPVFEQILVDDDGNLWVRIVEAHDVTDTAFDVFDPEGRYLGRVRMTIKIAAYPLARITRNAIHAVVIGDMDEPQVVRLRIVKPASPVR